MAFTLRSHHCGYDLLIDGTRAGIVYREPEIDRWLVMLDYGLGGGALPHRWQRWADVPEGLRMAACDEHATLADLCAAIGVEIGTPAIPKLREAA